MTRIMKLILENDLLPFFPMSDWFDAQVSLDRILELCKTRDVYPRYGILHNDINTAIDGEELLRRLLHA